MPIFLRTTGATAAHATATATTTTATGNLFVKYQYICSDLCDIINLTVAFDFHLYLQGIGMQTPALLAQLQQQNQYQQQY